MRGPRSDAATHGLDVRRAPTRSARFASSFMYEDARGEHRVGRVLGVNSGAERHVSMYSAFGDCG